MAVRATGIRWAIAALFVAMQVLVGCGGGEDTPSDVRAPFAAALARKNVSPSSRSLLTASLAAPDGERRQIQATAPVLSVAPAELFDWAEKTYPAYFPSHQADQTLNPYVFRYYPETGNYLGLNGQTIVVLGPISGGAILEVGKLADFACLVRPAICNTPPVANAGPAQSVLTGSTVKLDGSKSADADQNPLTFAWRVTSKPAGSTAALTDSKAVQPSFVADKPGQYMIELVVSDLLTSSIASTVTITVADANVAPVASAGTNQSVVVGATVMLTGSGSKDANGDVLTYVWSFSARPTGSAAVLSGVTTPTPTFVPDKAGTYTVTLVVNDGKVNSQPSTVTITAAAANAAPVANAGSAQTVVAGGIATLSGALSSDANGDALTYQWAITSKPAGSVAVLSSQTAVFPLFMADTAGTYVVSLIVNDGKVSSAPATVTITVTPAAPSNTRTVSVSRVSDDTYFSSASNLLILTNFCYEYVYFDSAQLTMTGSTGSYDGKIKFSNGTTCDVNGAYYPSSLRSGNYTATLTRSQSDIYKDSASSSVIWTQYCYQYVYYDRSTLQLKYGAGTAYASGAKIGTVLFSSGSTCNLVGIFSLAKLN